LFFASLREPQGQTFFQPPVTFPFPAITNRSKSKFMKLTIHNIVLVCATIFVFCSCKKENLNPDSGVAVSIKATNPNLVLGTTALGAGNNPLRTAGANVQWTSGAVSATLLKFEAKQGGSEVEFKSSVNQTVDLFGTGSIGNISIPAGSYTQIEFKAQLSPSGSNPAIELKGQFTSGAVSTNIIFRADESILLKGERSNVTINASTIHNAITAMDLSKVMQGITSTTLDNAVRTNSEILINAGTNANIYNIILKNLTNLEDEEEFH
jgi:hypothetical protein